MAEISVGVLAGDEVNESTGLVLDGRLCAVTGEVLRHAPMAVIKRIFVGEVEDVDDIAALVVQVELHESIEEGAVLALEVLEVEEGVDVLLQHRCAVHTVDLHLHDVAVTHQSARLVPEEDLRVLHDVLQHSPEAQQLLGLQGRPEDQQLALDPGQQTQLLVHLSPIVEEILELVLRGKTVGQLRALKVQVVVVLLKRSVRQLKLLVLPLEERTDELLQVSYAVPV